MKRSKFNRHDWNKRWRANQKALAKAIRQHRKRKHLRVIAAALELERINKLYGGLSGLIAHKFKKSYRKLEESFFAPNPLLEMLKKHGDIRPIEGGQTISVPLKYSEDK